MCGWTIEVTITILVCGAWLVGPAVGRPAHHLASRRSVQDLPQGARAAFVASGQGPHLASRRFVSGYAPRVESGTIGTRILKTM